MLSKVLMKTCKIMGQNKRLIVLGLIYSQCCWTKQGTIGILCKADPNPELDLQKKWTLDLEKSGPYIKFTVSAKNSFLTNSRVLISNITKDFFKFQLRNTHVKHFGYQIWSFLVLHKFYILKNSRVLISDMTIVVQNCLPKIPK